MTWSRRLWFALALGAAAALLVEARRGEAAQAGAPGPCAVHTPERIVAVGDVHGAYERFIAILRAAALVDNRGR